jgi:hypothetical protein
VFAEHVFPDAAERHRPSAEPSAERHMAAASV